MNEVFDPDAPAGRASGVYGLPHSAEQAGVTAAGWGRTWDPTPALCVGGRCALQFDGRWAYCDAHHLTVTTARAFADPLADAMQDAVDGARVRG